MILSEVMARPVVCDDERLGFVIDARFVLRGPATAGGLAAPELIGLVVGPRKGIAFLGYERKRVNKPALFNRFFAWRQAGSFLVDVEDVERWGETVELRSGHRRWSSKLPD